MKKSQLRQIIREELRMMNEGVNLAPKNLKTKKYRNGDPIRLAQSKQDWIEAGENQEGAYCIAPTGGYLYNWYAVNDPRGLCKVPTDRDWDRVDNAEYVEINWHGYRNTGGHFQDTGEYALFWSSTEKDSNSAWSRSLWAEDGEDDFDFLRYGYTKSFGFSVRCLQ